MEIKFLCIFFNHWKQSKNKYQLKDSPRKFLLVPQLMNVFPPPWTILIPNSTPGQRNKPEYTYKRVILAYDCRNKLYSNFLDYTYHLYAVLLKAFVPLVPCVYKVRWLFHCFYNNNKNNIKHCIKQKIVWDWVVEEFCQQQQHQLCISINFVSAALPSFQYATSV